MSIIRDQLIENVQKLLAEGWSISEQVFKEKKNSFIENQKDFFHMCSFGDYIIIRADEKLLMWAKDNFGQVLSKDVLDSDNMYKIEAKLRDYGKELCGEHLRFLYLKDETEVNPVSGFRYQLFKKEDMDSLYSIIGDNKDYYRNALNYNCDVIAYGAFDGDILAALAAADDYKEPMWQLGIDTLPEYRGRGLAAYLVKTLAENIVELNKIPFYTTWSANLASMNVAISSGFRPVWVEYFTE